MSHKQILETAIQKAIANGWDFGGLLVPMDPGSYEVRAPFVGDYLRIVTTNWQGDARNESILSVLYDHEFAKALWGDKNPEGYMLHLAGKYAATEYIDGSWHYHLQQMVIAEDPIKYLGENL